MYRAKFCPGLPNPGSFQAMRNGCKCDMLQNQMGLGSDQSGISVHWIINPDCAMHTEYAARIHNVLSQQKAMRSGALG